jgi:hypothetical protein
MDKYKEWRTEMQIKRDRASKANRLDCVLDIEMWKVTDRRK